MNTMSKLLGVTKKAGEAGGSKKSNSMSIDEPSDESSLSVERWILFCIPLFTWHLVNIYSVFYINILRFM